jgi:quinol monooxygenase YgiN
MIVVAGKVTVKSERRAEAVQAALKMQRATQPEAGCISYRFYSDLENPDILFVFEEWESAEALEAHFQTPHMAEFMQLLPELLAGEIAIHRYVIEAKSGL